MVTPARVALTSPAYETGVLLLNHGAETGGPARLVAGTGIEPAYLGMSQASAPSRVAREQNTGAAREIFTHTIRLEAGDVGWLHQCRRRLVSKGGNCTHTVSFTGRSAAGYTTSPRRTGAAGRCLTGIFRVTGAAHCCFCHCGVRCSERNSGKVFPPRVALGTRPSQSRVISPSPRERKKIAAPADRGTPSGVGRSLDE